MSVVLVTGGSRGIGAAIALACAADGHDIAINYSRNAEAAEDVATQVRAMGRKAITVQADVADEAQVQAMFERVDAMQGPLVGLVNNAGIVVPAARLESHSMARWQRVFAVNVLGTLACCQEAAKRMSTKRGGAGGAGGAIVNLSSRAAIYGSSNIYVDYAASKGAVDTLTLGLANELISEGIRVNGVRPGVIDTEIHADSGVDAHAVIASLPIGRLGRAEEIAEAVRWLLSPAASYCVGTIVDVAGGR